jgi:hypothetical protein
MLTNMDDKKLKESLNQLPILSDDVFSEKYAKTPCYFAVRELGLVKRECSNKFGKYDVVAVMGLDSKKMRLYYCEPINLVSILGHETQLQSYPISPKDFLHMNLTEIISYETLKKF